MNDKEIEEGGGRMWGKRKGRKKNEQANNPRKQLNNDKSQIETYVK